MKTLSDRELVEYRVVLIDPVSRGVLAREEGDRLCVLRVSIPPRTRVARQVRTELRRVWRIESVILDILSLGHEDAPCVVAELLTERAPADLHVVRPESISDHELSPRERSHLLRVLADDVACPFSRIGWIDEAMAWVERVAGRRLRPDAGVEQYNAGGAFSLLHFQMEDGQTYWFKATGVPNLHERRITCLLSGLCDRSLPSVVAEKPEWNAWLMMGDAAGLSALPTQPADLVRLLGYAVESLARLQIKTIGWDFALFRAGAIDQRLHILRDRSKALFAYVDEAMSFQTSTKVPRIEAGRLQQIRDLLEETCDRIDHLDMPSTILHGDVNLGNIVFTEDGCQFIDWCEGYVGHPLVTFQHLLLLNPSEDPDGRALVDDTLKEIYRTALSSICSPHQMAEGFACMRFLAAASALYGRGEWFSADQGNDPKRYEYSRCIARHMDRAAREPAFPEGTARLMERCRLRNHPQSKEDER